MIHPRKRSLPGSLILLDAERKSPPCNRSYSSISERSTSFSDEEIDKEPNHTMEDFEEESKSRGGREEDKEDDDDDAIIVPEQ